MCVGSCAILDPYPPAPEPITSTDRDGLLRAAVAPFAPADSGWWIRELAPDEGRFRMTRPQTTPLSEEVVEVLVEIVDATPVAGDGDGRVPAPAVYAVKVTAAIQNVPEDDFGAAIEPGPPGLDEPAFDVQDEVMDAIRKSVRAFRLAPAPVDNGAKPSSRRAPPDRGAMPGADVLSAEALQAHPRGDLSRCTPA